MINTKANFWVKRLFIFFLFCCYWQVYCQSILPFYYEKNLPLNGKPFKVSEYYYEYHTQVKAHYYDHAIQYDSDGRIKNHFKTNKDLLNPDSIPLTFKDIIDPRPVMINYSFDYDLQNRLVYFRKTQSQIEVGSFQQDEEWKYDQYGMLIEHNFWNIENGDTVIKNPSFRRVVYRDKLNQILKIEKFTYSFANKGLILDEILEFGYRFEIQDTITLFRMINGQKTLINKKYDISFYKYSPLNSDSTLFNSFFELDAMNIITKHTFSYDTSERIIESIIQSGDDTLSYSKWLFEDLKSTENTDGHITETYFDQTGYVKYEEEFEGGFSLAVPADKNTRQLVNGEMKHALLEIWDPVTRFYRKDTEYIYFYNQPTKDDREMLTKDEFQVYPNPTNGQLILKNWNELINLNLTSVDGLAFSLPIQPQQQLNLPKGLYMLHALFADGSSNHTKIVVR
jgi:hypothetical protein